MSSDRQVEQLREELEDEQRALRDAVARLEGVAREHMQPDTWIRRWPLTIAGAAILLGWRIGRR